MFRQDIYKKEDEMMASSELLSISNRPNGLMSDPSIFFPLIITSTKSTEVIRIRRMNLEINISKFVRHFTGPRYDMDNLLKPLPEDSA